MYLSQHSHNNHWREKWLKNREISWGGLSTMPHKWKYYKSVHAKLCKKYCNSMGRYSTYLPQNIIYTYVGFTVTSSVSPKLNCKCWWISTQLSLLAYIKDWNPNKTWSITIILHSGWFLLRETKMPNFITISELTRMWVPHSMCWWHNVSAKNTQCNVHKSASWLPNPFDLHLQRHLYRIYNAEKRLRMLNNQPPKN